MEEQQEVVVQEQPVPEKKVKKVKKPRSVPLRILMGLIAFILCIVMFVVSVACVAILDVRAVVSRNGISQIITQLISGQTNPAPIRPALAVGLGRGVGYASEYSAGGDMSGMLVDWAYDMVKEQFGDELPITKDQIQTFVEESTVKDFVADKMAGVIEDFYSGENETTITVDEITQLIEENKTVIQEQFGITITQEALDAVDQLLEESEILKPIEDQGLMGFVQENLLGGDMPNEDSTEGNGTTGILPGIGGGEQPPVSTSPVQTINQVMELVRTVTSYSTVAVMVGALVLLMVLLFFVTGCSIPATLADTGVVLTLTGLIYAAPTAVCLYNQPLWMSILGDTIGGVSTLLFRAASGVNFGVFGLGVAMIVAAIVIKAVQNARRKQQAE